MKDGYCKEIRRIRTEREKTGRLDGIRDIIKQAILLILIRFAFSFSHTSALFTETRLQATSLLIHFFILF